MIEMTEGYIYILTSTRTECVKIGGTGNPPMIRIREINRTEPYKHLGPWSLFDFRQVIDWRKTERYLHYIFRDHLDKNIKNQKELFHISPNKAAGQLKDIDPDDLLKKPKVDRLFQDISFLDYIVSLFRLSGILNWIDIQGAWTFVLFPKTSGGRFYTLNIGQHEVAFSTIGKNRKNPHHMLLMDSLINDFSVVRKWVTKHKGSLKNDCYSTALPRSTSVFFEGSFETISDFFKLDGVQRAIVAYWTQSLIRLKNGNKLSAYARHHNWNAIAEINKQINHDY